MKYDFIIAGAGCAGLSLLYKLLQEPTLQNHTILVIDKDDKKNNDRTWCYWEKDEGVFEKLVFKKWEKLSFLTTYFQKELAIKPYSYKMIRGLDFYEFVLKFARQFSNVTFLNQEIISISSDENSATINTKENHYKANTIFNSTSIFNPEINQKNALLQHFKGWVIKAENPVFDEEVGRLMDFRISQEHGDTFMYVLPTSKTEALVEYTLFTKQLLEKETYNNALKKYIKEELKIENYTIVHEEFGVIPMSLANFDKNPKQNVVNIGTAGGYTKASSGYTFQFIQKDVEEIIENLKLGKKPNQELSFKDKLYNWYDATLLDVLLSDKLTGKQVFDMMFEKIPPHKILAFLGNESTLLEDVSIMRRLPIFSFLTSGVKQLFAKKS